MAGSTTRMLIASVAFLTLACSGSQAPTVPPAGEEDQAAPAAATTLPAENEPPPVPEELPDGPGARELQPGEELEDEGPVGATSEAEVPPETSLHEAMEAY